MESFVLGLFTVLFGAVVSLAGYQLYRVLLPLWGLFAGFVWGAHAVSLTLGEGFLATVTGWGVGALVGIVGAILAYAFYQTAVAILVSLIGFYATYGFALELGAQQGSVLITLTSLLVAALLGIATIYFRVPKAVLMGLTAFSGAVTVVAGVLVMSGQVDVSALGTTIVRDIVDGSALWSITWATLAILGIASQVLIDRNLVQDFSGDYSRSRDSMIGALGGEVEKDRSSYNRFDDEEVESADEMRQRSAAAVDRHET